MTSRRASKHSVAFALDNKKVVMGDGSTSPNFRRAAVVKKTIMVAKHSDDSAEDEDIEEDDYSEKEEEEEEEDAYTVEVKKKTCKTRDLKVRGKLDKMDH